MGWGEPHRSHVDIPWAVWDAANNLGNRVREWNRERSTANEERMVNALSIYDSAVDRAKQHEETGRPAGW